MLRRLLIALLLLTLGWGVAETLVVYPIQSQDALLGVAVADRIATAFAGEFDEVLGPAVAPSLLPPLTVEGGFLHPTAFLKDRSLGNPTGAALAREAIGADLVVTGEIASGPEGSTLELYLADTDGVRTFTVRADEANAGVLVRKAVAILAVRLDLPMPSLGGDLDLTGPEGDYLRALGLIGDGSLVEAQGLLEQLGDDPRAGSLRGNLEAVLTGEDGGDPALLATMALSRSDLDETLIIEYFRAFAGATELPVPYVWLGALSASVDDHDGAAEAFDAASRRYTFGLIARASFRSARGFPGVEQDVATVLSRAVGGEAGIASLLGLAIVAGLEDDLGLEKRALTELTRLQPDFIYPYERLSFIAFDEDDASGAYRALLQAVRLDPDSDLYWTNLGWAYYLLGLLERSEEASVRAIELDSSQFIALYNLGLVRTVTGRLELAMEQYRRAVSLDPEVDDEAIRDLVNALDLYPDQPAIHYALAYLYDQEGSRAAGADQYELYLERAGMDALFANLVTRRIEILRGPPPPIEIASAVEVTLGEDGVAAAPYHPADTVYPEFEVFTPGDVLPRRLTITIELLDGVGEVLATASSEFEVPRNAIGLVIDYFGLDLPAVLEAGTYRLRIVAGASEGRLAEAEVELPIEGGAELLRQLIGRGIVMEGLQTGAPLYGPRDLARAELLLQVLVQELRGAVEAAEEALPEIESGRFEGLSGGELFGQSTVEDVGDFLRFLLAQPTRDATFTFVDAFAQWALDGAPLE